FQLLNLIIALGLLTMPLLIESSESLFEMLSLSYPSRWPRDSDLATKTLDLSREIIIPSDLKPLFVKIEEAS
ncbi:hypothetical protein KC614_02235, partial [candidate division WWE3 bacterium]|nr:hypothetical protein [candidate division WWE3 bacterium]